MKSHDAVTHANPRALPCAAADTRRTAHTYCEPNMAVPSMKQTESLMTAEELERLDLAGKSAELIRGHLAVREPPVMRLGAATIGIERSIEGENVLPGFSCPLREILG